MLFSVSLSSCILFSVLIWGIPESQHSVLQVKGKKRLFPAIKALAATTSVYIALLSGLSRKTCHMLLSAPFLHSLSIPRVAFWMNMEYWENERAWFEGSSWERQQLPSSLTGQTQDLSDQRGRPRVSPYLQSEAWIGFS